MRSETPQNVLLRPNLSNVETIRVEITNFSQRSFANKLLELQNRRVIPKNVAYHQDSSLGFGQSYQLLSMVKLNG